MSEVKHLCNTLLPSQRDWRLSHMCNRSLVEAFGTAMNPHKSKNNDFCDFLTAVRRIIEHVFKRQALPKKINGVKFKEGRSKLKLIQDTSHKFFCTIRVLE